MALPHYYATLDAKQIVQIFLLAQNAGRIAVATLALMVATADPR